ncbi:uncharacterized protein LOC120685790 [Panicum virgatum]|uniref:Disease resistance protein At4g27190-like leucine-rich repeats domain-containing protein n=1 Tax=Panicum virgatum TaxID=38727 RepID=A0A8T0PGV1_PANVG|nr:uncharacterized protein LOC120685790 [Panicum virgatum]XP_039823811.1 uncharacterized protein LOC120685790 [Panicum virgatum]XP_039823813.1 uncharacterized protein LOC120685790 [Panicum virgatum]KAG2558416.1 hypothetical protein PVAP13_8NG112801 [Panicum virgatum]KAG2558417.1 hypothetical protein PVAP13_8NG112801 [Panicum virgatum]
MDILDKQDEQDDFSGADEGTRVEIVAVGREIHQALQGQSCLVVFHNGSTNMIDLNDFGIPQPADRWSSFVQKVLWTFRGRLHAIPGMKPAVDPTRAPSTSSAESTKPSNGNQSQTDKEELSREDVPAAGDAKVDNSQVYLYSYLKDSESEHWNGLVHEEAKEIAQYSRKLGVTSETAALCCKYMLLLNSRGVDDDGLDYNWATHASNYWVCDGIIQEHQQDKAWEVATALLEEMKLEDFSSYRLPDFGDKTHWVVATGSDTAQEIKPETTSFFCANRKGRVASLPTKIFQRCDEQLHVLKLCLCTFSFSSPPFLHCRNIRFLGLDKCKDQPKKLEGKEEEDRQKINFFQSLWVLDLCDTDWELDLSPNIIESMLKNIREIHIKRGRIWSNSYAWTWRHLHNIHKLRVIEPTLHWKDEGKDEETKDEFMNMSKLELLDLSGNSTVKVLPRLSGVSSLGTLVLDGCVGLMTVAPEAIPPSLETFSFDAGEGKHGNKKAKISRISMAGCARLVNFRLRGSLLNLEELDLSNTSVKILNLKDEVVQVPFLQRLILLGCEQIRAILWPKAGMPKLVVLRIATRGGKEEARSKSPHDADYSLVISKEHEEMCHARVAVTDLRFLQSLLLAGSNKFCWNTARFNLSLYLSSASEDDDGQNNRKEKMGRPYNTGPLVASRLHKSPLILQSHKIYSDINTTDEATGNHDGSSAQQFQPLDFHVEIGEEISSATVVTEQEIRAVRFVLNKVNSLHVHDSFSMNTVIPGSMVTRESWSDLKWCSIERCPYLNTVFTTDDVFCFPELETFWGAHLSTARCIWSKGWMSLPYSGKLRAINLHLCPRLTFVLPLSWSQTLSSLETLRIIYCGDLTQVFPVEAEFLKESSTGHPRGELELPNLRHLHLHELPKIRQICEVKMFAPKLETVWVRGCWSLKRIPATTDRPESRPIVDCEKDWWNKLEWDGNKTRHHPSLFQLRHSKYYKKTLLRSSVLR